MCVIASSNITASVEIVGCTRCSWTKFSKKIEVFILFPLGRLALGDAIVLQPLPIAAELAALELQVVIDEHVSQLMTEERALVQRRQRLAEARRQKRPVGGVGLIVARPGLELALDAVEPGDDLRRNVEIRIRRRLADAVLQARRRNGPAAQDAHHGAPIVATPARAVPRQRARPESSISIYRGSGEHRGCNGVLEQSGEIGLPDGR